MSHIFRLQSFFSLFIPMQVRYTRVYLRETTLITPFPVLLFGGDIEVQHRERLLSIDGWIYFQVHATADLITLKFSTYSNR